MSMDWMADVIRLHEKLSPERIGSTPKVDSDRVDLLLDLIEEEIQELRLAIYDENLPGVADGMVDAIVTICGAATSCGIDLRPVWDAVQAANMAKEGGGQRSDGKWMKPPGWAPPDIAGVLSKQGPLTGSAS